MNHQSIINRDVKSRIMAAPARTTTLRPTYLIFLGLAVVSAAMLWGIGPEQAKATRHVPLQLTSAATESKQVLIDSQPAPASGIPAATEIPEQTPVTDTQQPVTVEAEAESDGVWHEITIKNGDSLALIFSRLGLSPQQLHRLTSQEGAAQNLKKIYPGQTLRLLVNQEQGLLGLHYPIDKLNTLKISRVGDDFEVSTTHQTPERRVRNASGVINSSLFLAANAAGLSDNLTMKLANIFAWDIDFALDIREGDRFTLLYEELYLDGEKIDNGNILAAEFINRGKTYQAVSYTDQGGKTDFYSLDGKSMRKAFLRTPVEFSRISSRFSLGRKHPILNRIRAHKGVDYAAARGTPIRATGNGKIIHRGKKGGYGKTVIVKHGTQYSTLYAHMSNYKRGLKVGSRVQQGDIIGYIGSSGLATGPHLHYEFRVNGAHRDPLRVKLPGAEPLAKKYHDDFISKAEPLIAQLDLVRKVQIASNE